jgi:TRAP-type C4-dicarboxylate transport system permease large subunit
MSGGMLSVYALATCSAALGMLLGLLLPPPAVFLIVTIASVSGLFAAMVCAGLLVGAL